MLRVFITTTLLLLSSATSASDLDAYTTAITRTALHQPGVAKQPLITIDGDRVRMVSFATDAEYQNIDNHLGKTIWTSVEPELKTLCQHYVAKHPKITHAELTAWLSRMLGMPTHDATERHFVIFDAPAIQAYYGESPREIGIFRPCTDPRIGKHTDGSLLCPAEMNTADTRIASAYKTWFINFHLETHNQTNGFPWTGYGYTYNWNSDAESRHGVSEFVVLKNTPISPIATAVSAKQYCAQDL